MPIDFNPHFYVNNNTQQNVPKQVVSAFQRPQKDIFIKNVSMGSNFDGIEITDKPFGKIDKTGEIATLYTITNKNGASVDISTYGATITSIKIPDKDGRIKDVVQGYSDVTPYEKSPVGHAGSTIGPYANKIGGGEFSLNGKTYTLECNKDNGQTHSHGGTNGFDTKNWKAKKIKNGVEFSYSKKDMESGYPGDVDVKVKYLFDNDNKLHIIYSAKSNQDTILNLTNHTYFNLDGAENAEENSIYEHIVELPNSSKITENSEIAVPTGEFISTSGTPFDFKTPKKIGDVINSDDKQIQIGSGFDQNYCIDNYDGKSMIEIAKVKSEKTGINLKVSTNLPGFQFYTANHLGKSAQPNGKDGKRYMKRSALCVEPQFYPNAINTESFKEKGILKAGEEYSREIDYEFSI